jgi:hypothetical protein
MRKLLLSAAIVATSIVALTESGVAQMTQSGAREAEGRRICRYTDVTGKIAARRRVCMTRAEWDRAAEEQRKVGQTFVSTLDSCGNRGNGGPCPQ